MKKYLEEYRAFIAKMLKSDDCNFEELLELHKEKILFFQHERLIHLIVTVLFAVLSVSTFLLIAVTQKIILVPLALLFMALLIPYIKHYYFLENQTQELYRDFDRIAEKAMSISLVENNDNKR